MLVVLCLGLVFFFFFFYIIYDTIFCFILIFHLISAPLNLNSLLWSDGNCFGCDLSVCYFPQRCNFNLVRLIQQYVFTVFIICLLSQETFKPLWVMISSATRGAVRKERASISPWESITLTATGRATSWAFTLSFQTGPKPPRLCLTRTRTRYEQI